MVRETLSMEMFFSYVTHDFHEFDYFDIITDALDKLYAHS